MIVHLVGSLRDIKKDYEKLRAIVEVIHDHGGVLAHDLIEHDLLRQQKKITVQDWIPYVQANLKAVKNADVVIIDTTHHAFTQGYLLAAALEHKKPTLLLSGDDFSDKYISGLTNSLLSFCTYETEDDLRSAVKAFLRQYTVHTKDLRFNMFLTREIVRYLETVSHETGRNQSEIIRSLIKKKIQK